MGKKERKRALTLLDNAPMEAQEDSAVGSEWLKKQMKISEHDLDLIYSEDYDEVNHEIYMENEKK